MRIRPTLFIALALVCQTSLASVLAAQQAPGADFTGTWVINRAKSDFGTMTPPTIDSSTVTRTGSTYQIDATTDFGGQGTQHSVLNWPVGDGETTTDLPNGATLHTTTRLQHDTTTFSSTISVQGQTVALHTGRKYRSQDGKTLTREMEIQPLVGPSTESLHFRLVYDKR
jgi:hypothetical protein